MSKSTEAGSYLARSQSGHCADLGLAGVQHVDSGRPTPFSDYRAQAAAAYRSVYFTLTSELLDLTATLGRCGGSAGADDAGRQWSDAYDVVASNGIHALEDLRIACGQMHSHLVGTGADRTLGPVDPISNHHAALRQAGMTGRVEHKVPPTIFGGSDLPLSGWTEVKVYVRDEVWPDGHPDRLFRAAAAWSTVAAAVKLAAVHLRAARCQIELAVGPGTDRTLYRHDIVVAQFGALARYGSSLASECVAYGSSIESTRAAVVHALAEMDALMEFDLEVGWSPELSVGSGVSNEARNVEVPLLKAYGERITGIIRGLRVLAQAGRKQLVASKGYLRDGDLLTTLPQAPTSQPVSQI